MLGFATRIVLGLGDGAGGGEGGGVVGGGGEGGGIAQIDAISMIIETLSLKQQ